MTELRVAGRGDREAVAHVHVRGWQAAYRGLIPDVFLDGLSPEDRVRSYTFGDADGGGSITVVASQGGIVRGFATIGTAGAPGEPRCGTLQALYVDPAAWRTGIGRLLIERARAMLADAGFDEAMLWVLDGNERAEAFYVADGWRADGFTTTVTIGREEVGERRFRRHLVP